MTDTPDNTVTIVVTCGGQTYRHTRYLPSLHLYARPLFDRTSDLEYELTMTVQHLLREIEFERTGRVSP